MLFRIYNKLRMKFTFFLRYKKGNQFFIVSNYIPESLIQNNYEDYIYRHSNKLENNIIVKTLVKNGFNYIGISPIFFSNTVAKALLRIIKRRIKYVLFQDSTIFRLIEYPSDVKFIYYSTGCYFKHQNNSVIVKTNEFNMIYSSKIPYIRLNNQKFLDQRISNILSIGTKKTISTYPDFLHDKFINSGTISLTNKNFDFEEKLKFVSCTDFIWMGTEGSVLKGIGIVFDYFKMNEELNLHIIGTLDSEVYNVLKILKHPNIHLHGYLNLQSNEFLDIVYKSMWVISPSVSEGIPGSIINLMKMGCIPIMSEYSVYSDYVKTGYILKSIDYSGIDHTINLIHKLDKVALVGLMKSSIKISSNEFSKEKFEKNIERIIKNILK